MEIYLKFIGRFDLPEPELTAEEAKRQEQLRRHRIKSRERYQKIKAGEHAVGQPFKLTCKCCGEDLNPSVQTLCFVPLTVVQDFIGRKRLKTEVENVFARTAAVPLSQQIGHEILFGCLQDGS